MTDDAIKNEAVVRSRVIHSFLDRRARSELAMYCTVLSNESGPDVTEIWGHD
jgi:hypothetical protein